MKWAYLDKSKHSEKNIANNIDFTVGKKAFNIGFYLC